MTDPDTSYEYSSKGLNTLAKDFFENIYALLRFPKNRDDLCSYSLVRLIEFLKDFNFFCPFEKAAINAFLSYWKKRSLNISSSYLAINCYIEEFKKKEKSGWDYSQTYTDDLRITLTQFFFKSTGFYQNFGKIKRFLISNSDLLPEVYILLIGYVNFFEKLVHFPKENLLSREDYLVADEKFVPEIKELACFIGKKLEEILVMEAQVNIEVQEVKVADTYNKLNNFLFTFAMEIAPKEEDILKLDPKKEDEVHEFLFGFFADLGYCNEYVFCSIGSFVNAWKKEYPILGDCFDSFPDYFHKIAKKRNLIIQRPTVNIPQEVANLFVEVSKILNFSNLVDFYPEILSIIEYMTKKVPYDNDYTFFVMHEFIRIHTVSDLFIAPGVITQFSRMAREYISDEQLFGLIPKLNEAFEAMLHRKNANEYTAIAMDILEELKAEGKI